MSRDVDLIQKILDNTSRRSWSAREYRDHDNVVFELLDADQNRIALFNTGNDSLLASAAPDFIDRFCYMLEAFNELSESVFSRENNSVFVNAPEQYKKIWSRAFKDFKAYMRIFEDCLHLSLECILYSREARLDPYEKKD